MPSRTLNVRPFQIDSVAKPEILENFTWPPAFLAARDGKDKPLDLEVGCGVGWHPIRYAEENPERLLIAIEHTRLKYEKFYSRLIKNQLLENLLPVHADAVRWVSHALNANSLDRCLLLYPNPEPKAPNKRWLRMPFMHRLLETLKPGGEIVLATNDADYFREALTWAKDYWRLSIEEERSFSASRLPPGLPRTHFEKKYLARGETCFDVHLRKPYA